MSNIHIQGTGNTFGDGNAFGDGNRIFVDKRTVIKNRTVNSNPGSNRPPPNDAAGVLFVVAIMAITALIFASWKFAQYAPVIYSILLFIAFTAFVIQGWAQVALDGQSTAWQWDQCLGIGAIFLTAFAVAMSAHAYRFELTDMAQQATWTQFWCGLTPYGGQLASFHMLTMSCLAAPALILAMVNAIGAGARWQYFSSGSPFFARAVTLQRRSTTVLSLLLASAAFLSQFDVISQLWPAFYDSLMSFAGHLCKGPG